MRQNSGRRAKVTISVLGMVALASLGISHGATADEVFDWNVTGFEAAVAGGQNTIQVSRTMAMMHIGVHDVLNAIDRCYEPYLSVIKNESTAATGAAIAAAARDQLSDQRKARRNVLPWSKGRRRGQQWRTGTQRSSSRRS